VDFNQKFNDLSQKKEFFYYFPRVVFHSKFKIFYLKENKKKKKKKKKKIKK